MRKFIIGLALGLAVAFTSVAFAADSIKALLFPASFEINGSNVALNKEYKVLNVDGHAYVPIRFVAENIGATIDYDADLKKVFIKNKSLDITDPVYKGISVGNLILTKVGNNTQVTGQLSIGNMGNTKNKIAANLTFYNDNSKKIGEVIINGTDFGGGESRIFTVQGTGDFRTYETVNLHISSVNNKITEVFPSTLYENTKHNFSLVLPKSWEGKYEAIEGTDSVNFIDLANKEAGWGGYLFTIQVWTKEKWSTDGVIAKQNMHLYKIGERGDEVFTLSTPTDVNYNVADDKLKIEYAVMWDHINTIKTTFKFKELTNTTDYLASLNITLPEGWNMDTSQKVFYDFINAKGENGGSVTKSAYDVSFEFGKPNHSSIIKDEYITVPLGKCRLITLDSDNGSAASGLTGTHNEYYAVIPVAGKINYTLNFNKNDKELQTKEQFIKILKSLSLK